MIAASHYDINEAYAAIDRHRLEDNEPYIYRTRDGGKTWQRITNGLTPGVYMQNVTEDPVRKGLLFAGTELSVFVSFDDGDNWQPLQLNLPHVSMRDLAIHEQRPGGRDVWTRILGARRHYASASDQRRNRQSETLSFSIRQWHTGCRSRRERHSAAQRRTPRRECSARCNDRLLPRKSGRKGYSRDPRSGR